MKKYHRFFTQWQNHGNELVIRDPAVCHQIHRVLKLHTGEHVLLCDGTGEEYECVLSDINTEHINATLITKRMCADAQLNTVTLCCAVLKRENFEWVVQKATEVGVSQIIPLLTDHTVKTGLKQERLEKIAAEAAELAGRGRVPKIFSPQTLEQARTLLPNDSQQLFFHIAPDTTSLQKENTKPVACWIGPEGGWSEKEISWAKSHNFTFTTLGPLTLRGETAALLAVYSALECGENGR